MDTIGLHRYGICYTAIPRCANTSIKRALWKLQTGKEFERYIGDGPFWPHSTSKIEIHRNDISEFNRLSESDLKKIEGEYDFWFTVIDNPLRRLFSAYYMLILLEDPHLAASGIKPYLIPPLENISYSSIISNFEEFIQSQYLEYLMQNDVHFIPQSKLLKNLHSSKKLRFYSLNEVDKLEHEINSYLRERKLNRRIVIPRDNSSLVTINQLQISLECRRKVELLYQEDQEMLKAKNKITELDSRMRDSSRNETLMSIGINEIRARNRRIAEIYWLFKKSN